MTEPSQVYDSTGGNPFPNERDRDQFCAWLRGYGVNPDATYRVEIHDTNPPFAKVFTYLLDDNGVRILNEAKTACLHQEPYDVPLTSLPPAPEGTP